MEEKKPVNIYLMGKLGKLFGKKWSLHVNSPAEAIRAIDINLKGKLTRYLLTEGAKKYYKVAVQKKNQLIDPRKELKNPTGNSDIYIIPTIKGSDETAQIVVGVILVIVDVAFLHTGYLTQIGIALVLGGVAQLLTPTPKFSQKSNEEDPGRQSNLFQGNASSILQGNSVGLVYGRALVAPMPISVSTTSSDIPLTVTKAATVEMTELPGGGVQYSVRNFFNN